MDGLVYFITEVMKKRQLMQIQGGGKRVFMRGDDVFT